MRVNNQAQSQLDYHIQYGVRYFIMLTRRQIVRAFKLRGWILQPGALEGIEVYLAEGEDDAEDLQGVLEVVGSKMKGGRTVTQKLWEEIVKESDNVNVKPEAALMSSSCFADVKIENAFQTPKLVYEAMRKQFDVQITPRSLFGSVEDKTNMLAQRYALTHQRILRHKLFRPNDLHHGRSTDQLKLTPIESLLGKRADAGTLLLLGILVQIEEGQFYLEDPTGQVAISFQDARAVDGFFLTEHCIVLVEGTFQDDMLYVHRLGHPLLETRETSLAAIQQQVSHPSYRVLGKSGFQHEDSTFVILSDVQLDRPKVLQQLEGLFASYENYSPYRMPLFILMGNFCSQIGPQGNSVKEALGDLFSIISKFPTLAKHAHFCIVPGPNDIPSPVLPLPPIQISPMNNNNKVAHLHMASNPCRIRWGRQEEIVVFRHDLLHILQQRQILLASSNDDDTMMMETEEADRSRQPNCRLVKTILDQGHLIPVAGVPIFWNYDHALRLYPLPTTLVLGGDDAQAYHENYGGCNVIHPGSVATKSSCAVYRPYAMNDEDDDDETSLVEIFELGNNSPK